MPSVGPCAKRDLRERSGLVDIKAADIRFVVDELVKLNEGGDALAGQLDLSRLGILGHSFGGGAAAEVCRLDDRIRAGASIDGGLWKAPTEVTGRGPSSSSSASTRSTSWGAKTPTERRLLARGRCQSMKLAWPAPRTRTLRPGRACSCSDYLLDFFGEHLSSGTRSEMAREGSDDRVRVDEPRALFA